MGADETEGDVMDWQPARLKPEEMWCEAAKYEHTPEKIERIQRAMKRALRVRPDARKLRQRDCGCPLYLIHPEDIAELYGYETDTVVSLCQIWTD